jgi:hypothetical protein
MRVGERTSQIMLSLVHAAVGALQTPDVLHGPGPAVAARAADQSLALARVTKRARPLWSESRAERARLMRPGGSGAREGVTGTGSIAPCRVWAACNCLPLPLQVVAVAAGVARSRHSGCSPCRRRRGVRHATPDGKRSSGSQASRRRRGRPRAQRARDASR